MGNSKKTRWLVAAAGVCAVAVVAVVCVNVMGTGSAGSGTNTAAKAVMEKEMSANGTTSSSATGSKDNPKVEVSVAETGSEAAGDSGISYNKDNSGQGSQSSDQGSQASVQNLKWEEFYALSSTEKDNYKNSYPDRDAFYDWMVAAQAQFKVDHPDVPIGSDGSIDLSKL